MYTSRFRSAVSGNYFRRREESGRNKKAQRCYWGLGENDGKNERTKLLNEDTERLLELKDRGGGTWKNCKSVSVYENVHR